MASVFWTAIFGTIVGVVTFVCSAGGVPFGAVLFRKGLPFGAVLSYIYADLIVPSIIDTYQAYYRIYRAGFLYWLHRQDSGGQGCQKMPASAVD